MPQLNPAPWFLILIFSWITLFFFVSSKILNLSFYYEPSAGAFNKAPLKTWNWLWQ